MAIQASGDLDVGQPLGRIEHHPRALHIPPRGRDLPPTTLKLVALVSAQLDHVAAGPGHDHQFAAPRQPPSHNPQDFRTAPLETERARLAERLRASGRPTRTDGLERRMDELDRRCGHYALRAQRLQAERDATSWLKRKERKRLDVALESAASAWARLEDQRLEARAEVERLTGHRDAWLERHRSDAGRYLDLDAERQNRHTLHSLADRRLNRLADALPRLEVPRHDAGIELDGPDLGP